MKKLFSWCILLSLVLSQFQIWWVYANEVQNLKNEKESSITTLSAIDGIIEKWIEKIDKKIKDPEKSQRLQEKQEEIKQYLEDTVEDIERENSSKDIQEKVEEARKVVVLKVVAWVTDFEDTTDSIPRDVANTKKEKIEAADAITDSLETASWDYSIIVKTRYSKSKLRKTFDLFDTEIQIDRLYDHDDETYFEITMQEDSIFRQEMLEDISSWVLPETFLGIEIVLPEVFSIWEVSLQGEDLTQTWGIEEYQSYKYFDNFSENSKKIKVAVIDTGIDYTHSDLADNVNQNLGKDFVNEDDDAIDDQWHGTHVAGSIAANINESGIIGINPYIELVPLKICTSSGFCPSYGVLRALDYAKDEEIDILNMSLWGRATVADHPICDGISSVVESGGIVVAASGNSNIDTSLFVPGGCSESITVWAYDRNKSRASFSNYGSKVDILAPWVDIYSTKLWWWYHKLSGTSMAAPHVAGIVSIIQSYDSGITSDEVKQVLKNNSSNGVLDTNMLFAELHNIDISEEIEDPIIEEVIEEPEEVITNIQEDNSWKTNFSSVEVEIWDTSIPSDIPKAEIYIEESIEDDSTLQDISISSIDIWDESIVINTQGEFTIENIPEVVEEKDTYIPSGNKTFDGQWNIIDDVQINSQETLLDITPIQVWPDFDISNLPENKFDQSDESDLVDQSEEIEEPQVIETYVWWAQPSIRTNNFEEGEIIELEEYSLSEAEDFNEEDFIEDEEISWEELEENIVFGWELPSPEWIEDIEYEYWEDEIIEGIYTEVESFSWSNISIQNDYTCDIFPGQLCRLRIYRSINYDFSIENPEVSTFSRTKRYLNIRWVELGTSTYQLDYKYWDTVHIITVNVTEKSPILEEVTLYEWRRIVLWNARCSWDASTDSPNIVSVEQTTSYCYAVAIKPGIAEVNLIHTWNYYGYDDYKYIINVIPIPEPEIHNIEFTWGNWDFILWLPDSTDNYDIEYEYNSIYEEVRKNADNYHIKVEEVGESQIIITDERDGFVKYIINISSVPSYRDYTIHVSDEYYINTGGNYDYDSLDESISRYRWEDLHGYKVWETEIHVKYDGNHLRKIWRVNVLPKPDPIQIDCEIMVWEGCDFTGMRRSGQYIEESNPGMLDINWYTSSIKVDGEASGNAKIYVHSQYGDYISHILNITVHPKPPKIRYFDTLIWMEWESSGTFDRGNTHFTVSEPGIVNIRSKTYEFNNNKEVILITWEQVWEVEIYIYENGDHVMTLITTIVPKTTLNYWVEWFQVYEWEEITATVSGWYAPYEFDYNREEYVDLKWLNKETWEFTIEWEKESITNIRIRDKYDQTGSVLVHVLNKELTTDVDSLTLAPWETWYINIPSYHTAVHTLFQSNNNVLVYRETWNEWDIQKYRLKVDAHYSGTSNISFKDYSEPHQSQLVIPITVTGNVPNPDFKEFRHPDAIDNCVEDKSGDLKDGLCEVPGGEEVVEEENIPFEQQIDNLLEEILNELWIQSVQSENTINIQWLILSESQKYKIDAFVNDLISRKWRMWVEDLSKVLPQIIESKENEWHKVILDYLWKSIEKQLEIRVIHSIESTLSGDIWWLEFEISENLQGKISNIGVQYFDGNWNRQEKELKIQSDGRYIIGYSGDSCNWCRDFKPYYLLSWRDDIFIASLESSVKINASPYSQFIDIITSIWNWKGYSTDWMKEAVVDLKEDIKQDSKNIAINLILQNITKAANIQIWTRDVNIDTLPVAWYMLDKFLNNSTPYAWRKLVEVLDKNENLKDAILYKDDHWISEKFWKSIDYQNIINLIEQGQCNYPWYEGFENLNNGEEIFCVNKDDSNFNISQEFDLYMATNAYSFSISILKKNDKFYSKIMFWDEYDFEENTYWLAKVEWKTVSDIINDTLSNNLNYLGNHYEKFQGWNNFWWAVEVINEL